MNAAQRLWRTSDNIIMTNFEIKTKADIALAFARLGVSYTINNRSNRYYDDGLLATTTADSADDGEFEEWLIIAWETMREDERQTWLCVTGSQDRVW